MSPKLLVFLLPLYFTGSVVWITWATLFGLHPDRDYMALFIMIHLILGVFAWLGALWYVEVIK